MNITATKKRAQILACLVEGNSIRATSGLTGAAINTVVKLLCDAGKAVVSGSPEFKHGSTSHTERQNLTMRMSMRRFTRLTNGFSKKAENHEHAVALHFMHYNCCRIHQSLRVTPAMEAGITVHVWSLAEVVEMIDLESN